MARKEPLAATQILRAGNFAELLRRGPRKRGSGGKANMGAEPLILSRPPASFGSFSTRKRNSPRRAKPLRDGAPSRRALQESGLSSSPHPPPSRAPSLRGESCSSGAAKYPLRKTRKRSRPVHWDESAEKALRGATQVQSGRAAPSRPRVAAGLPRLSPGPLVAPSLAGAVSVGPSQPRGPSLSGGIPVTHAPS